LNVGELNAARVLLNEAGMLAIFLILGLVLVTGGQMFDRVRKTRSVNLPD
jgi:hypothetical protein